MTALQKEGNTTSYTDMKSEFKKITGEDATPEQSDKLKKQDNIWRMICKYNNWPFHSSF